MNTPEQTMTFSFKAIETIQQSLNPPPIKDLEAPNFTFNIELNQSIDLNNKNVFVAVAVKIGLNEKQVDLASHTTLCVFEVANLADIILKDNSSYLLPSQAAVLLNSVALSTARGVMFSFFKGTYLQNAILPIIDPQSFQLKKV